MRHWALALVAAAALAAPSARGDALGGGDLSTVFVGAAVVVEGLPALGFGIYDVVKAAQGERVSKGAAIAELIVFAPEAVGGIAFGLTQPDSSQGKLAWTLGLGLVPTVMVVHAIYQLAAPGNVTMQAELPSPHLLAIAPTLLRYGGRTATGVALAAVF